MNVPWIRDHRSNGSILYPASGMVVMAIEAMRQLVGQSRRLNGFTLKEITMHKALLLSLELEGTETEISLNLPKGSSKDLVSSADFHISVLWNGEWTIVCDSSIATEYEVSNQTANVDEKMAVLLHHRRNGAFQGTIVTLSETFQGFREGYFSILALDIKHNKPCILVEGYRIAAIDNPFTSAVTGDDIVGIGFGDGGRGRMPHKVYWRTNADL